jgi:hypothetical protein
VREAYRDINSFFNQIRDPIEQQQSRTHRRIGVQEGVEHRSHVKLSKPEWRGDRQQSTRLLLLSRRASLCDVERREYLPTSCKVGLPELRQAKRPRASMHERHRETALEQRDRTSHCCGRAPEPAGSRGQRASIDRGHECPHGVDPVHRCSFRNQPLSAQVILSKSATQYISLADPERAET